MPFETTLPSKISNLPLKIPVTGSDPSEGVAARLELVAEFQTPLIRPPYNTFAEFPKSGCLSDSG